MQKEKIIIIGCGEEYEKMKYALDAYFEIIAVADSSHAGDYIDSYRWIAIENILHEKFDKLVICAKNSREFLKQRLINIGVDHQMIIDDPDYLHALVKKNDMRKYEADKKMYIEKLKDEKFLYTEQDEYPVLADYRDAAGELDGHYFLQDIIVANHIIKQNPPKHFDIGSRIDGFISHLAAGNIDVTVMDVRPLKMQELLGRALPHFHFIQSDATNLINIPDNSILSLSTLHAVEHFGLGRYGDEVEPDAWRKCIQAIQRVLAQKGRCYFSLPVGKTEKVCFNAHRIFSPETIIEEFDKLHIQEMYLIHDWMVYEYGAADVIAKKYMDKLGDYDCGIFVFEK